MSPLALSILKYSLLVLLYLFVFQAIRSVAADVSGRRRGATGQPRSPTSAQTGRSTVTGHPTMVVVHDGGGGRARTVRLSGRMDIGRSRACAIRLRDEYVSQVHASLYESNGSWHVQDSGSTNGTYLNDGLVAGATVVKAGDRIRVGKTVLELAR